MTAPAAHAPAPNPAPAPTPGNVTAPAPIAPAATPPSNWAVLTRALRGLLAGTPGRLRVYGVLSISACLLFGVLCFVAAAARAGALSDARSNADQLVRIQNIRINLVSADASLTNAYLVGGLEPAGQRAAYEAGIASATSAIAQASNSNSADADVLARVNNVVAQYTGLVESARAGNRLGVPLGAAYLRSATNLLRTDALPALEQLAGASQKRVDDAYSASAAALSWLIVGLILAVAALLVTQLAVMRRTRRIFNLALVSSTVIVVVFGAVLSGAMAWSQNKATSTRSGAYFTTLELSTARVDAFDAKSAESLTLIARGSGQLYQARYAQLAADTKAILADAAARGGSAEVTARDAFTAWDALHTQIRTLDDSGDVDAAVARTTGTAPTDSNARFAVFDRASGTALTGSTNTLDSDLGSARTPMLPLGWLTLAAGVIAALAAWRGISTRLREYR